jgi:hypothetical protein
MSTKIKSAGTEDDFVQGYHGAVLWPNKSYDALRKRYHEDTFIGTLMSNSAKFRQILHRVLRCKLEH